MTQSPHQLQPQQPLPPLPKLILQLLSLLLSRRLSISHLLLIRLPQLLQLTSQPQPLLPLMLKLLKVLPPQHLPHPLLQPRKTQRSRPILLLVSLVLPALSPI